VTLGSEQEGDVGDGPARVTAKAASAGSRPTAHGPLSRTVHRVAHASALAQLFGQSVSFVQTVILARLLTPMDVGIFSAGTVLTVLFTDVAGGGLQAGLVRRQGDLADADETVFRVTLMVGAAASLVCLAAAPLIGIIFHSHTAGLVAAATSGILLLHALTNVPEAVLQREFSIKRRLIVGPAIAVSYAAVAIVLAALGWGIWSMVVGTYASYIAWVVSLWMLTSWRPGRGHASFALWRELARYGFPLALAMIGFRARTAVESLVVGRFLSTTALGFFRYGQRIALIPEMGIIQVGATTLFPAFSRIADDHSRFAAAYLRALHWAMVCAAAATGLMIATGEPAVVVLLGERWRGAGVALVAMAGLGIGSAVAVVAQDAIKAHGRTRLINWLTVADLFLGVAFLLILIRPFGFVGASLYISLTSLVDGAVFLALAQRVVTAPLSKVLKVLATPMPGLLIATAATWWLEHDILRSASRSPILAVTLLAVDALVFCLIYLAVLTLFARSTVITIVGRVPVLIGRFRRRALADTTTSPTDHAAPSSPPRQSPESVDTSQ
jgi:O-antigen/teichoic acid export membrane protein